MYWGGGVTPYGRTTSYDTALGTSPCLLLSESPGRPPPGPATSAHPPVTPAGWSSLTPQVDNKNRSPRVKDQPQGQPQLLLWRPSPTVRQEQLNAWSQLDFPRTNLGTGRQGWCYTDQKVGT